jgi:hypothetical protein
MGTSIATINYARSGRVYAYHISSILDIQTKEGINPRCAGCNLCGEIWHWEYFSWENKSRLLRNMLANYNIMIYYALSSVTFIHNDPPLTKAESREERRNEPVDP